MPLKAINDIAIDKNEFEYNYQKELTIKLDNLDSDYDQSIINEIVLWKLNRYAKIADDDLRWLNKINKTDEKMDVELTKEILRRLLATKGIALPMASTILRFKNPKIYQIIDQRAYRFIYGKEYEKLSNNEKQINLYLDYLDMLKKVCIDHPEITFIESDRILYQLDKKFNKSIKLK